MVQEPDDIDKCSILSEHEMVSDLFDFSKIMESKNFGIKRYKQFAYKG